MERSLLGSGNPVQPFRPKTQTWLNILDPVEAKDWDEASHPRDERGRFSSGDGGGASAPPAAPSAGGAAAPPEGPGARAHALAATGLSPIQAASLQAAGAGPAFTGAGGALQAISDGVQRGPDWGNGTETGSAAKTITPENSLGFLGEHADNPAGTQALYKTGPNGTYSQARLDTVQNPQVHATIDHVQPRAEGEPVRVYAMGGGPAAGKSTVLRSGQIDVPDETHASRVNADEFKTGRPAKGGGPAIMANPEYAAMQAVGQQKGAAAVHEESSDTAARAIKESLQGRKDTVVDAVLNHTADKVASKIAEWKRNGADEIHGSYVTVPVEEAVTRAVGRANDPTSDSYGRHVPESVVRDGHISVARMFPELVQRTQAGQLFDTLTLHDTNVPRGQPAKLLISVEPGQAPVIHDPAGYAAFLERGTIPLSSELEELGGPGFPGTEKRRRNV